MTQSSTSALTKRLWRDYVRHYKGRIALIVVTTLLMAAATALYPFLIKWTFWMFGRKDSSELYFIPFLILLVTGVRGVSAYFQAVLTQDMVLRVIRQLQEAMFSHLTLASLTRVEREAPAQLATRFTADATVIRDAMTRAVNAIADVTTIFGLVVSMVVIDWKLSLIAACVYPIAVVPVQKIGKRIRRASGGMQETMGHAAAMLTESFAQARTVRAYGLEAHECGRAEKTFADLYAVLLRMTRIRARLDPMMEILAGVAVAGVIALEAWRNQTGSGVIGDFMGFTTSLLMAARPLRALGSMNAAMQAGLAGLVRVFQVVDEPASIADVPNAIALPPGPGEVVFDHVGFTYPDGRPGLVDLSFYAAPGRMLALVGSSGAGKSTALALIPRLYDPTSGVIRVDGVDIEHCTLASLRHAIAYVGQEALLFDDTISANIRLGRPTATDEEVAAAAAAAACGFIKDMPEGFATRVGVNGQRLSGGQRQRVSIARAILRDPRILVLDEATSALDTESEALVQSALARLREGRTTIVVAHRLSTVRDADQIVVMAGGKVVETGTHADLLEQDGAFARLVRAQALSVS